MSSDSYQSDTDSNLVAYDNIPRDFKKTIKAFYKKEYQDDLNG